MSNAVLYKNITYLSLKKLVKSKASTGISYAVVAARIRNGWSLEKALNEPKNKNATQIFSVEGKKYTNLRELAQKAGISYGAAIKRSHRGWSDKEIFYGRKKEIKLKPIKTSKSKSKTVLINGKKYKNLRHAFESINPQCTFNTLRARLRYGWSIQEALEINQKIDGRTNIPNAKKLTINGNTLSIKEAVDRYNVPHSTILYRLNGGATSRQAVGLQKIKKGDLMHQPRHIKNRTAKTYTVDGIVYKSVTELARVYKLPTSLVYNRMHDNGWSSERAVKEHVSKAVEVNGKKYRSALNAWNLIGQTNLSTYESRKARGLSLETCLGLKSLPSHYELNGVSYSSINEVSKDFELSTGQLQYRLKSMSLEQAIVYKPANGRFSTSAFKKNSELANTLGLIYFVKITLPEGILHKIGITTREVLQRFHSHNIEIITEIKGKLYSLYNLEQLIISKFSALHYRAEDNFEGRTETFLLTRNEEKNMLNFINEHLNDFGLSEN